jgi:hypothetical protein
LARSRGVLGELGGPQGLHCRRVSAKMLLIYLSLPLGRRLLSGKRGQSYVRQIQTRGDSVGER